MRTWIRDNGLTTALLTLFAASLVGQVFSGWAQENESLAEHGQAVLTLRGFLTSGEFLSTLFENWESEFLQMWAYVMLTAFLFQRGSPESKDPDEPSPQDRDPGLDSLNPDAPAPVRKGGMIARLYAHSLGLAMMTLFLISFVLHWLNSARVQAQEAIQHGEPPPGMLEHLTHPQLWFESFQNWQSEFLSTAVLVVLGIYLRERGSPESKPVAAPHRQTGGG
ncbi:MAG TPA: DUF6766 family protein [Phenylobacterium sp.]